MKIKFLHIEKFRHLNNLDLSFGRRITAIAGQNATGKSTILGLVGHIFSFREKENKIIYNTLDGNPFETEYSEIFRFSYPKFDKAKEHKYSIELDNEDKVPVISVDRRERGKEKSLRLVVGKKVTGEGKRQLPVIYLGLRRLFPLAQEDSIKQNQNLQLTDEETTEYNVLHNAILGLDERITTEFIEVFSKKFYGARTLNYDTIGNSAGQDNIGQILTAIFSFSRLKEALEDECLFSIDVIEEVEDILNEDVIPEKLNNLFKMEGISLSEKRAIIKKVKEGEWEVTDKEKFYIVKKEDGKLNIYKKYNGGILLLDEIDASLYPGSQLRLVQRMFRWAQDLDLQIIFTTHSTDVLQKLLSPECQGDSEIIFLSNDTGEVKNLQNKIDIERMINNLRLQLPEIKKRKKIYVYCEDNEANLWLNNLLGTKITKNLKIISGFPASFLISLANFKIPDFKKSIFVLDGDQDKSLKNNKCPQVVLLPGKKSPENVFYDFLNGLEPKDEFWESTGGYTKQIFKSNSPIKPGNRDTMKNWFKEQKPHWGARGCTKLFTRWKKTNEKLANNFKKEFEIILNSLME